MRQAEAWLMLSITVFGFESRGATHKGEGRSVAPFELILRVGKLESFEVLAAKLQVVLRNRSKESQRYLAHAMIQPPKLALVSSEGRLLKPEDNRDLKVFDSTPYPRLFRELGPGAEAVIAVAEIQKEASGDYHLSQGQFHFRHLQIGSYTAIAEWESGRKPLQRKGPDQPLWMGRLVSNEVVLSLN